MELESIYQPIKDELIEVDQLLKYSFKNTKCKSILEINNYLLEVKGKRLRPALVLLSAKATSQPPTFNHSLTKVAAALEIIHTASLIHDDVIDHARLRHNKPTINSKWGSDISIALGDYLYSVAFKLISQCGNKQILECISSATKAMCEGELLQVGERDNLSLLKERYILIVKKKTAALFSACCQVGAMFSKAARFYEDALRRYGLNFGIAFQIIDDCLDLIGEEKDLGKSPGIDFKMGELTLPLLHLFSQRKKDRVVLFSLLKQPDNKEAFKEIKRRFINSSALLKTKEDIYAYIQKAKNSIIINRMENSCFKESLFGLADYIVERSRL